MNSRAADVLTRIFAEADDTREARTKAAGRWLLLIALLMCAFSTGCGFMAGMGYSRVHDFSQPQARCGP